MQLTESSFSNHCAFAMFLLVLVLNLTFPQILTKDIYPPSFFWSLSTSAVSDLICHHEKQSSRGWHLTIQQVTFPYTALESQGRVTLGSAWNIHRNISDLIQVICLRKYRGSAAQQKSNQGFPIPCQCISGSGRSLLALNTVTVWKEINIYIYIYGYSYERKELNHNKNPSLDITISLQISLYKILILEEAWIVRKLQSVQGQLSSKLQVK